MSTPPRIWASNDTPAKGELVRVRGQVRHVMETGLRRDANGQVIPKHIINSFTVHMNETLLIDWSPETAMSQNPFFEFTFIARESGTLRMVWTDDAGAEIRAERVFTVS